MPVISKDELKSLLQDCFNSEVFLSLSLTSKNNTGTDLPERFVLRPVEIKKQEKVQWTAYDARSHQTHSNFQWDESFEKVLSLLGTDFSNAYLKSTMVEYQIQFTRKNKIQLTKHKVKKTNRVISKEHNASKQYLFPEGIPVPFLVETGIMTPSGQVHKAMFRKFKQINRFAEFVHDVKEHFPKKRPVKVVDYGCGKSYLTFAVHHLLVEKLGFQVEMTGFDSNLNVIESCLKTKKKLNLSDVYFEQAHISEAPIEGSVDLAIWLHACDTATDDALARSIEHQAKVILASPCCQHELFKQVNSDVLEPMLKHGIMRERFAAMATDTLRAQLLEALGYRSQIIEFIDLEHTAKNLLLRAIRSEASTEKCEEPLEAYRKFKEALGIKRFHLDRLLASNFSQ